MLVVDRCRNHVANLLSSLSSSKISNLALEFRHCQSSRDVIISGLGDISIFPVVGRCCTHFQNYFPLIALQLVSTTAVLRCAFASDSRRYR